MFHFVHPNAFECYYIISLQYFILRCKNYFLLSKDQFFFSQYYLLTHVHQRLLVDNTGFILITIPIIDEHRNSQRVKSLKSIRQVQGFYNIGL